MVLDSNTFTNFSIYHFYCYRLVTAVLVNLIGVSPMSRLAYVLFAYVASRFAYVLGRFANVL